jgi:transposase InsO family protein
MIVELSVVEQRYQAVLFVIRDGESVVDVASRFGVSRQTVHTWLLRYEQSGLAGLANRSHKPVSSPSQMPSEVEVLLLEMRRKNPSWGPRRLHFELAKLDVDPLPSLSGIYRALKRAGVIDPNARRRRDEKFRRWERGLPMELWQMDVVGGILLADGNELKCLTAVDDHSRFCVSAGLMSRANSRSVCEWFAHSLRTYGVPSEILTDNGKVFTGRFGKTHSEVLFDRICRENGIDHLLTAPRSPTTTGKIERFHRSLRTEFLSGKIFDSQEDAQTQLDAWVHAYNTERPHQSLNMQTPAARFTHTVKATPRPADAGALDDQRNGETWITRKVCRNGVITVAWQQISVGRHREGRIVDVHVMPEMLQIWDGNELLKSVSRNGKKEVRKKNAQVAS